MLSASFGMCGLPRGIAAVWIDSGDEAAQTCLVHVDKRQLGKHQDVAQALEEKERTGLFRLQEQVLSRKSFSLKAYGSWMNF